jgi:hypothetical protein
MNKTLALAGAVFASGFFVLAGQPPAPPAIFTSGAGRSRPPGIREHLWPVPHAPAAGAKRQPGRIAAAQFTFRSIPAIHWTARFCPASGWAGLPQPLGIENRRATDRAFSGNGFFLPGGRRKRGDHRQHRRLGTAGEWGQSGNSSTDQKYGHRCQFGRATIGRGRYGLAVKPNRRIRAVLRAS